MTSLFSVDFENGNLYDPAKGFDIIVVTRGTMDANTGSSYEGIYGCEITPSFSTTTRCCGMKKVPHLSRLRQAFYIHPNAISLADGKGITLCRNYHNDASRVDYKVILTYSTGIGYEIQFGVADNTRLIAYYSSHYALTTQNGWNLVEFDLTAGNPGRYQGWLDGVSKWTNTTVVNDAIRINYPSLGVSSCDDDAVSGSFYVDYWRANDTGDAI